MSLRSGMIKKNEKPKEDNKESVKKPVSKRKGWVCECGCYNLILTCWKCKKRKTP